MVQEQRQSRSLGRKLGRGALVIGISTVATRGFTIVSQFLLGWLLRPEDFGAFAAAFALAGLMAPLAESGMGKLLIQKGASYEVIARAMLSLSLVINALLATTLLGSAVVLSRLGLYAVEVPLCATVLAGFMVSALAAVFKAKLIVKMRFNVVSRTTVFSSLIQAGVSIGTAATGMGAYSFALGFAAGRLYEYMRFRTAAGSIVTPHSVNADWSFVKSISRDLRWLLLGSFSTVLILQGEYLALNWRGGADLGTYYFAAQLSLGIVSPFTIALQSVLLPGFGTFFQDRARTAAAYLRATAVLQLSVAPLCGLAAMVASPIIAFLWRGKWDAAAPLVSIMMVTTMIRCVNPVGRSVLEAAGRWSAQTKILILDAVGTLVVSALAMPSGLIMMSLALLIWRILINCIQALRVASHLDMSKIDALKLMLKLPVTTFACATASYKLGEVVTGEASPAGSWIAAGLFLILYGGAVVATARTECRLVNFRQLISAK